MTAARQSDRVPTSRLLELARLGVELRWTLVTNRMRRRGKRTRRWTIVFAVGYAALNIAGLATARIIDNDGAEDTLIVLSSSMALGWIFGPVLMGGVDETIDPNRLALLPLRRIEHFVIQLSAALSGAGPIAAIVGFTLGITAGYTVVGASIVIAPLAALVLVLLVVGLARSVAAALTIAQRSRTGRDAAVLLASLIAGALFVLAQLAGDFVNAGGEAFVDALAWAPWAWPARAIIEARAGHDLVAIAWLVAATAMTAATLWTWSRLSSFLLLNGERVARSGRRGDRPLLNGADSVFGASMSRQWIYLRRSPNSRVGFIFGLAFGVAFAIVQILQRSGVDDPSAPFGILLAMVANLGATTNVLGFDAGSLWLEVLANGPRRPHMLARVLIALPNLLIPTWSAGLVVGVWTGQWRLVALACLLALPVAVIVLVFGIIVSTTSPAPLFDGDNPFGNRQAAENRGPRLILVGVSAMFGTAICASPMLAVAYVARNESWVWIVPFVGLGFAIVAFGVAMAWVGRRLRGHEPVLIEQLSPLAYN